MELADINRREVLRYLGYKNQEADENVSRIVKTAWSFLWKNVSPKYWVRIFTYSGSRQSDRWGRFFRQKAEIFLLI